MLMGAAHNALRAFNARVSLTLPVLHRPQAATLAKDENRPRLIQFCGTEDFLYENNQKFRKVAESNGYGHVYMEGPGDHEWPYWDKMIQRAIQFFLNLDLQTTKLY